MLIGDTGDYNQKIHNEIRNCYNSLWNGSDGIETYYTKLRNKSITEYEKHSGNDRILNNGFVII